MPFPTQDNVELPLLRVLADAGGELRAGETIEGIAELYPDLTEGDLRSTFESGINKWQSRVQRAKNALLKKGEVSSPAWGVWRATKRGFSRLEKEWTDWRPEYQSTGRGKKHTRRTRGARLDPRKLTSRGILDMLESEALGDVKQNGRKRLSNEKKRQDDERGESADVPPLGKPYRLVRFRTIRKSAMWWTVVMVVEVKPGTERLSIYRFKLDERSNKWKKKNAMNINYQEDLNAVIESLGDLSEGVRWKRARRPR